MQPKPNNYASCPCCGKPVIVGVNVRVDPRVISYSVSEVRHVAV